MTMCNSDFPVATAFSFLEAVQKEFYSLFTKEQLKNAIRYSLNNAYKEKLMVKMVRK